MIKNKPNFSLISTFRYRDATIKEGIARVKRHLDSLKQQTYTAFELILINSGSTPDFTKVLENLVNNYNFVHYIYTETRGFDWNKAYVLNLGLEQTNTENIIISDIDLIYESNFLNKVCKSWTGDEVLIYRCFYLPQHFKTFDKLNNHPSKISKKLKISVDSACGIIVCPKTIFEIVGNYDEYYRVWGLEDIDFISRVDKAKVIKRYWTKDIPYVFHQWHENTGNYIINNFYKVLQSHLERKQQNPIHINKLNGKLLTLADRPVLAHILNKNKYSKLTSFKFTLPVNASFVDFIQKFQQLGSQTSLCIKQSFPEFSNTKSRLKRLVKLVNKILSKLRISYRVVEIAAYEKNKINWQEIRDFLRYFISYYEDNIEDYYFDCQFPEIYFVLIKK